MSFWKKLFSKNKTPQLPKIKKEIYFKELVIKLYEVDWRNPEVKRNIEAFGKDGNPVWIVEEPHYSQHYWDMQIDEDADELEAESGSGRLFSINLVDGHIISSRLIK